MAKSVKTSLRSARKTTVSIKKEPVNEELKEFAETAMNELLGWYGYAGNREDVRTGSYKSNSNSNSSGPDSPIFTNGCGWCGKTIEESTGLSAGSASFCSELCFSQSRRANFKKNKTCDWCRHVRHTVSYVDFQDCSTTSTTTTSANNTTSQTQLQFCSDKCLNQYKMHIFCRETQAHLEYHPHLVALASGGASSEEGVGSTASGATKAGLITPDLWMRNCKTPEEMGEDRERTPSPPDGVGLEPVVSITESSPRDNRKHTLTTIPLIKLTDPAKLLASPPLHSSPGGGGYLKRPSTVTSTVTSPPAVHRKCTLKNRRKRCNTGNSASMTTTTTTTLFNQQPSKMVIEEEAQDLSIRHVLPEDIRHNSSRLAENLSKASTVSISNEEPTIISEPHRLIPETNSNSTPKEASNITNSTLCIHCNRSAPNVLPPVTVLVPYPIMVPVPLPIPIPLPISSFLKAYSLINESNTIIDTPKKSTTLPEENLSSHVPDNTSTSLNPEMTDNLDVVSEVNGREVVFEEEIIVDVVNEDEEEQTTVTICGSRPLRKRKRFLRPQQESKSSKIDTVITKKTKLSNIII